MIKRTTKNKTKILLVYSSEIQSTAGSASLRVAPIGLFFVNGYLLSKGHETKIIHFKVTSFNKSSPENDQYKDQLRNRQR